MAEPPVFYFARMLPAYRHAVMERLNERLDGRLVVDAQALEVQAGGLADATVGGAQGFAAGFGVGREGRFDF